MNWLLALYCRCPISECIMCEMLMYFQTFRMFVENSSRECDTVTIQSDLRRQKSTARAAMSGSVSLRCNPKITKTPQSIWGNHIWIPDFSKHFGGKNPYWTSIATVRFFGSVNQWGEVQNWTSKQKNSDCWNQLAFPTESYSTPVILKILGFQIAPHLGRRWTIILIAAPISPGR